MSYAHNFLHYHARTQDYTKKKCSEEPLVVSFNSSTSCFIVLVKRKIHECPTPGGNAKQRRPFEHI
jgi:hypothetical protein